MTGTSSTVSNQFKLGFKIKFKVNMSVCNACAVVDVMGHELEVPSAHVRKRPVDGCALGWSITHVVLFPQPNPPDNRLTLVPTTDAYTHVCIHQFSLGIAADAETEDTADWG